MNDETNLWDAAVGACSINMFGFKKTHDYILEFATEYVNQPDHSRAKLLKMKEYDTRAIDLLEMTQKLRNGMKELFKK